MCGMCDGVFDPAAIAHACDVCGDDAAEAEPHLLAVLARSLIGDDIGRFARLACADARLDIEITGAVDDDLGGIARRGAWVYAEEEGAAIEGAGGDGRPERCVFMGLLIKSGREEPIVKGGSIDFDRAHLADSALFEAADEVFEIGDGERWIALAAEDELLHHAVADDAIKACPQRIFGAERGERRRGREDFHIGSGVSLNRPAKIETLAPCLEIDDVDAQSIAEICGADESRELVAERVCARLDWCEREKQCGAERHEYRAM